MEMKTSAEQAVNSEKNPSNQIKLDFIVTIM